MLKGYVRTFKLPQPHILSSLPSAPPQPPPLAHPHRPLFPPVSTTPSWRRRPITFLKIPVNQNPTPQLVGPRVSATVATTLVSVEFIFIHVT
uniref:Uncharacterized protein n=1 Tax=Cucumis melo TaxID=3656 RepID=A0A9I9EHX4_CUCME